MSKDWIAEKIAKEPDWRPYCLVCSTMMRMRKTDFGFECRACKNQINPDMTHHYPDLTADELEDINRKINDRECSDPR